MDRNIYLSGFFEQGSHEILERISHTKAENDNASLYFSDKSNPKLQLSRTLKKC